MHVLSNSTGVERFLVGSRAGAKILQFLRLDFLAMSDYYAWELANIGKIPTSSIHQATWGTDLNKFVPKAADDKIREELGLGHGPVIGAIARLQRVKGCHKIIAAMPTVLQICPETQLLIVGDGPQRQALEDQAKDLQVEDNVIFTGWRTDTLEMNAQMDAYIQTTNGPNLGLSALQAMAQAKAQIVFAKDEFEEKMAHDTIQEGVNGHVVPTNEPRKAGEIIGKMLTDRQKLKKMGLTSRKIAEEKFDWDLHVSKVIEIYQELIDKN
jgi:glycosyltransferase involved in cell wall biosynthesis